MSDSGKKWLCLGIITGVHGIHGEVLIKSYTQDPLAIKSYGPLRDEAGGRSFTLKKVRLAKKGVVARIKGVEDRNSAEALKGTKLFVDRALLPAPDDEDDFYYTDLIGLTAVLGDGTVFGTVTALHDFGAGDLIEIQPLDRKSSEIFPFNKATIPKIDIKNGKMTLNPPLAIETDKE